MSDTNVFIVVVPASTVDEACMQIYSLVNAHTLTRIRSF